MLSVQHYPKSSIILEPKHTLPSGRMLMLMLVQAGHGMVAETSTTCKVTVPKVKLETASLWGAPLDGRN